MRNESGRSAAYVFLGILVLALALIFLMFTLSGMRLVNLPLVRWHAFDHDWLFIPGVPHFVWAFAGMGWLISLILAVWVAIDANRRGMNSVLWGALVFFTFVVGLVVYLIVAGVGMRNGGPAPARAPAPKPPTSSVPGGRFCRACGKELQPEFRVCPYCGETTGHRCPRCDRPVATEWKACPDCGAALSSTTETEAGSREGSAPQA